MLFSYKYLSDHKMEKMQRFMDYIFKEIWCKAKDHEYKLDLFDGEPDLKIIMPEIFKSACKDDLKSDHKSQGSAKYFYKTVQEIFLEFKSLSDDELLDYGNYFRVNNEVSNLCSGAGSCSPILYKNLNTTRPSLNNKIEAFFTNIYSSGFFDLVDVKNKLVQRLKVIIRTLLGKMIMMFVRFAV